LSVKSKISLAITLIVFVLLALNVIVNDYAARVNLRKEAESDAGRIAGQLAAVVGQYDRALALYEQLRAGQLREAAEAAAAAVLPGGHDRTPAAERLNEAAAAGSMRQLSVLRPEGSAYRVVQSTDGSLVGRMAALPDADRAQEGRQEGRGGLFLISRSPAMVDAVGESSELAVYFRPEDSGDLIAFAPAQDELWARLADAGPADHFHDFVRQYPELREMTVYNPRTFRQGMDGEAPGWRTLLPGSEPIRMGTYKFASPTDAADVGRAAAGRPVLRHVQREDGSLIKAFAPVAGSRELVVGIVTDDSELVASLVRKRYTELAVGGVLLLLVVLCSYWLAGYLIRPVKTILWKVGEVAAGRFDSPFHVRSRDEFGQLAERINAMSKNLDIYTAKLKMAFEENRAMKEHLESFINHTADAIHVVDLEGRTIQVNRAFEELFGWTAEEAVGQRLQLVPEPYQEEEQRAMAHLASGKPQSARETVRMTKQGDWISVNVTTSPIRDRNGTIRAIASITRDMTSRNKMEELLRQSEKLTTVGQLAAGVAHEIRNPLTTLRGFLQLQQQTNRLNPRHIDLMLSELDRINLIVGEFLILAKPQASRFEVKDVRFVLGDVISLLDSQAHLCNIIFDTRFIPEACEISCEENQLKQVFINVLKNAIEAMPSGGMIGIGVERAAGGCIAVKIADEGIGIPEEMIPKLGDPFFTAKETGTGLGIMVSQRIIQSHQGTMEIQSKLGVGTTVIITLPPRDQEQEIKNKQAM